MEVNETLLKLMEVDSEFVLMLEFTPLKYIDAGPYTCSANLNITDLDFFGMASNFEIVDVQSKFCYTE